MNFLLYPGFPIFLGFHSPLYSGLSIMGGSHSPSISSSQSSGLVASGSATCSGWSQSSGLVSSASSILARSSQSSGFFGLGILDLLRWQNVPIIFEGSLLGTFVINENFIGGVRINDKGVQVSKNVILASDFFGN